MIDYSRLFVITFMGNCVIVRFSEFHNPLFEARFLISVKNEMVRGRV